MGDTTPERPTPPDDTVPETVTLKRARDVARDVSERAVAERSALADAEGTPPDDTEGLREQLAERLKRFCPHFADDPECAEMTSDAVLAVLVEPPGDLREQMAAAIRRHHNAGDIRSEDWSVAGDVCACGVMVTDWVGHLAEVMASVRWGDAARRIAAAEARADFAEGQLSARRDHETRWETAEAKADRLRARVRRLRRDREEYWTRASTAEAQVEALQRNLAEARQLAAEWQAACEAQSRDAEVLTDAVQRIRALHRRIGWDGMARDPYCAAEGNPHLSWPCPTITALDARPDDPEEIRRLAEGAED